MTAPRQIGSPIRAWSLSRWLCGVEEFIERSAPGIAIILVLGFTVWAWCASRGVRLWFDELLQLAVAAAPTNHDVISYLEAGVDSNPPLSHYFTRVTIGLFGNSDWAARLPSFLGVLTLLVCIYVFVSRWLNRACAVLAMLIIVCLPVRVYAIEARPYGIELGLCALGVVFYQQAVKRRSIASLAGIAVAAACLAATHYYAVLIIGAFVLAEAVRIWTTRRPDWALLAACIVPPTLVIAALHNVWEGQRRQLSHYWGKGNILSFHSGYDLLAMDPLIYAVALMIIGVILGLNPPRGESLLPERLRSSRGSLELSLGIGLLFLPIVGAVCTQFITHAYSARYFVATAVGFTICTCYCAKFFGQVFPGLVALMVLALGLGFTEALVHEMTQPAEHLTEGTALASVKGAIVFDSPAEYLQVHHYYPNLRGQMWIVADPALSLRRLKFDSDDRAMLAIASVGRAQAITLSEAVRKWPNFALVPRPGNYVSAFKCVVEAGAETRVTHMYKSTWPDPGVSNLVVDVTVVPQNLPQIDQCSANEGL